MKINTPVSLNAVLKSKYYSRFKQTAEPILEWIDDRLGRGASKYLSVLFLLLVFAIAFLVIFSSSNKSGNYVLGFSTYESCQFSNSKDRLPVSCDKAMSIANEKSDKYQWPFVSVRECQDIYSVSSCKPNSAGYLSVKPSGFAYIEASKKYIVPVYKTVATEYYVLPSGYPIRMGESETSRKLVPSAIDSPKPLSRDFCFGNTCETMAKHMNLPTASKLYDAIANGY